MKQKNKQSTDLESRSPMDDEAIIALYFARDEKAIAETDLKYRKHLFSVIYDVLHDNNDCDECLNDTYLGIWNSIPPARPAVLKAFLTVIARRAAIKRYHSNKKKGNIPSEIMTSLTELGDIIADDGEIGGDLDADGLGHIISDFIRSLPERRQYIFMSRYYSSESIDIIARALGLSRSMINKELASIRNSLREKLRKEGYSI